MFFFKKILKKHSDGGQVWASTAARVVVDNGIILLQTCNHDKDELLELLSPHFELVDEHAELLAGLGVDCDADFRMFTFRRLARAENEPSAIAAKVFADAESQLITNTFAVGDTSVCVAQRDERAAAADDDAEADTFVDTDFFDAEYTVAASTGNYIDKKI